MSAFPGISLILFAEPGKTDEQIWGQVREFGKAEWRTQVILVHDNEEHYDERITYRPFPEVVRDLPTAIALSRYEQIAIVEPGERIEVNQWRHFVDNDNPNEIVTAYSDAINATGIQRILIGFYFLMTRLFFRTRKNELTAGFSVVRKSLVSDLARQLDLHTPPMAQVTQLLALCRLNRINIRELRSLHRSAELAKRQEKISGGCSRAFRFWWNTMMFPGTRNAEYGTRSLHSTSGDTNLESTGRQPIATLQWSRRAQFLLTAGLFLVASFLLFANLNYPLFEPDEARNAQLAINVIETGDWLTLSLQNKEYWDKPPLQIWAIATSYHLFGQSPFTTRIPVALAALLTVMSTLLIGRRLVGFTAAFAGAVLLLLSVGFIVVGRYVTMDASLTLVTTLTFGFGWLSIERSKWYYTFAAGTAFGLGVMVKGPVIVVICGIPLLIQLWLSRPAKRHRAQAKRDTTRVRVSASAIWSSYRWLCFLIPAALISMPWYLATAIVQPEFIEYFFWKHHVVRFSDAFNHREPFWYYAVGLFVFMFPASHLLPSVTKYILSRKPENRLTRTRAFGFLFLSAGWIIVFFTLSTAKLPTYILPAFPLICLMMGVMLESKVLAFTPNVSTCSSESKTTTYLDRLLPRASLELAGWVAMIGGSLLLLVRTDSYEHFASTLSVFSVVVLVALAFALALLTWLARKSNSSRVMWPLFAALGLCFVVLGVHQVVPGVAESRSIHSHAVRLKQEDDYQSAPVVFFDREPYGSGLKLNPNDTVVFAEMEIGACVSFVNEHPHAIIVSNKEAMKLLRSAMPWTITFEKCDGMRHLYLSRPNRALADESGIGRKFR